MKIVLVFSFSIQVNNLKIDQIKRIIPNLVEFTKLHFFNVFQVCFHTYFWLGNIK